MQFDVETYDHGTWSVVAVRGEVDVASAPGLREAVIRLVSEGHSHLVIDLEAVDFIDSTGLGVLVGALKRVRVKGGELRLVCTNSRVLKVFDITGLDAVFPRFDSVEAATT